MINSSETEENMESNNEDYESNEDQSVSSQSNNRLRDDEYDS